MGCTQSRMENEEAVSRCKDRKQLLKEAIVTRTHFAVAHSGHTMALKNIGAALGDYGEGEAEDHRFSSPSAAERPMDSLPPPPPPSSAERPLDSLPLPPPPLPNFSPSPLVRSFSMPDLPSPKPIPKPPETIREEDATGDGVGEDTVEPEPTTPATPLPPPPPPSESADSRVVPPPPPPGSGSAWDFFCPDEMPGTTIHMKEVGIPPVQEEIQEVGRQGEFKKQVDESVEESARKSVEYVEKTPEKVVVEPPAKPEKKKMKQGSGGSSSGAFTPEVPKKGTANVSLLQILHGLDSHFLKASESCHEVSKLLEATRMHYHSNFADNQGSIDHSARVMRVITWSKPSTNTPNSDGMDRKDEWETHATVLDKLLAWEKKLYDEVKEGEIMKYEYHRKVALLNKQKKRGSNPEALEKTKAAVSHLHTRYIVDMQSMDATISEIHQLRDHHLYPKLVDLVGGMAKMWETMPMNHEKQQKLVADLRALDLSDAPKETSNQHHRRTRQLCRVLDEWNAQFQKLMTSQKEYIQALNSWLKLTLIPIDSSLRERMSSTPWVDHPPIQFLLRSWHEQLDKLPFELAQKAISSFAAVMNAILVHQEEELMQKDKCEEVKKEYERKYRAFEEWHQKYLQRKSHGPMSEVADPERIETGTTTNDPFAEKQFAVDALKKRLDDETETYYKLCKQVREKSYGTFKTYLPELVRTMSDFAHSCSEMYKKLQWTGDQSER